MTNSTGLVGSHAIAGVPKPAASENAPHIVIKRWIRMLPPRVLVERKYALALFQLNAAAPESCLLWPVGELIAVNFAFNRKTLLQRTITSGQSV
jgi:hypothetical protein